ncbi:MAG: SAVED domain-containing protein [Endozoicomonadaceae bacterium]|nr:SAVED domain-containing protein [Endozoicomonadaceae bacterium]
MNLITHIAHKAADWAFRKRSPALVVFSAGLSLLSITLVGGLAINAYFETPSQLLTLSITNSDIPSTLVVIGFYLGVTLVLIGLVWELYRAVVEHRRLAKQTVLTIEQRGLVNTSDSPLSQFAMSKYRGKNVISIVIDVRDRLVNGIVNNPAKALSKFLNLEHTIEERRNHIGAEDFQIVYGGLVPVPFSFLSGYLLDDESSIDIIDWDRGKSSWLELETLNDDKDTFSIKKVLSSNNTEVVVAVSFSYHVDSKAIDEVFTDMTQIHLQLENQRFDNHWSKLKQNRLAYEFIEAIKSLIADGYEQIHLVLACQNSVAFRFGQAYDRRNLPPVTIYQYERSNSTKYPWGVNIPNSPNSFPSIVECSIAAKET